MVILKASYIVKAAEQTTKRVIRISEFDQVAAITHSPLLFFYRTNKDHDFDSSSRTFKDSLSKALVNFYPLAGRLNFVNRDRFELDCNSNGARLVIAESKHKIEDFGDFQPSSPKLISLFPVIDYTKPISDLPLLTVQLTKLAHGGICLGFSISHVIADATSAFQFINELARIVRGDEQDSSIYNPPFFDRSMLQTNEEPLKSPNFEHSEYRPPPLLVGRLDSEQEQMEETSVRMLKLSLEQIQKLVAKANYGRTAGENSDRPYTKFEAVSGHIWRSVCKSRKHNKIHQQLTRLYFPVDVRRRVEPNLPLGFFGNAVCRAAAGSIAGELQSHPLSYASSRIREAINTITDEYVRSSLQFLKNHRKLSEHRSYYAPGSIRRFFHGNPNMAINSFEKLPMKKADFGWGKLVYIGPAASGSDGRSLIIPSLDEDGGFTILLRLQNAYIADFEKLFYQDI